jgi:hexosaminidase
MSFNGTTEAMFIGGAPIPSPWTACFWVKRQDATEPSAALLTDPSTGLKLEQWMFTRQVGFTAFGVADYSFAYSVPADVWTHLTFVSSEGGTIIYANGTAVETNAATINLPLNILGARENGHDYLQGQLDETTLFNRALSPAEIQQVLNETRGP